MNTENLLKSGATATPWTTGDLRRAEVSERENQLKRDRWKSTRLSGGVNVGPKSRPFYFLVNNRVGKGVGSRKLPRKRRRRIHKKRKKESCKATRGDLFKDRSRVAPTSLVH